MAKPTNYLGAPIERQRQFKIPEQHKINALIGLTDKITQAWTPLLPEEILCTLMVVKCEPPLMVITTTNHTIANHLNYTYNMLLELIHQDYPYLQNISQIKFKVIAAQYLPIKGNLSAKSVVNPSAQRDNLVTTVTSRKISATTRQNITQLAQDVTLNPRLAKVLLRLASEDEPTKI